MGALGKSIAVDPENIDKAISDTISKYFHDVWNRTSESVAMIAAETVVELKRNSPKDKGEYADSWVIYQTRRAKRKHEVVVANRRYQLTHLLEHGHVKVAHGKVLGFTDAVPHIGDAERRAIKKLVKRIEDSI